MRQQDDARNILIKKSDLIKRIYENKKKHIKEYNVAVKAFRKEAAKQLKDQTKKLNSGEFGLHLRLIAPVNNELEYDKLVEMFNWEIKQEVELSQGEFNEYVLGETQSSRNASISNTMYLSKGR